MQQMKSKRDLAIDQVPITTKPPLTELLHINEVTRSDFKNKEESPYKPDTLSRSLWPASLSGLPTQLPIKNYMKTNTQKILSFLRRTFMLSIASRNSGVSISVFQRPDDAFSVVILVV